jgi:hypothetical protein
MVLFQFCPKSCHVFYLSVPDFTRLAPVLVTIIKPDDKGSFYMAAIMLFHMKQKYSRPALLAGLHIIVLLVCGRIGGFLADGNHLSD